MSKLYNNVLKGQTEANKKPRKKLFRGPDDTKKATKKAEGARHRDRSKTGMLDKKGIKGKKTRGGTYRTDI